MKTKIKIVLLASFILLFLIYIYLVIFGLNITIPRKEMAKSIPFYGEYTYSEECEKEKETLILSVEMGIGHTYTAWTNKPTPNGRGLYYEGGAKCFVEIHSNGWMKIFYCAYREDESSIIANYDFIGRKFLITPWQYRYILATANDIEKESITAECVLDNTKEHWYYQGKLFYPVEYSYGVDSMPYGWEDGSQYGRIFYNEHWYMGNDVTRPLIDEFRVKNNWIAKQVQEEEDKFGYIYGW